MSESAPGYALEMRHVGKRFPGTIAVDDVSFEVSAGEVHALVGENGAGKSTLMKMLAGSFDDYTGEILIEGKVVLLHSPTLAKRHGIGMIYQELSLARPISITENLLAGRLPRRGPFLDKSRARAQAEELLASVGLDLDPNLPIEDISQHEAQLVEIAKVLGNKPSILVMDEPTSALSREEVERLFAIIGDLKRRGIAIVYISHHLPEIFRIADRVTVMRDGKKIATRPVGEVSREEIVQMMVGRSVKEFYRRDERSIGEVRFRVKGLSRFGFFHGVDFEARRGEILGICGLSGAGRTELARVLAGLDRADEGSIELDGKPVRGSNDGRLPGAGHLLPHRGPQDRGPRHKACRGRQRPRRDRRPAFPGRGLFSRRGASPPWTASSASSRSILPTLRARSATSPAATSRRSSSPSGSRASPRSSSSMSRRGAWTSGPR